MRKIEVLDIRLVTSRNTGLAAFVDLRIDDIEIRDFRVMLNGGRPHVKAPFQTYKNTIGEIQFRQIIDLPGEVRAQVDAAVLNAYFRAKENRNVTAIR